MIRFYLLPTEQHKIYSGPKYFHWRYDPDPPGIDCFWSKKDYGAAPACVLAADIAPAAHQALATLRDVYPFPPDLDGELRLAEIYRLGRTLARLRVPAHWLNKGHALNKDLTGRQAVRLLAAMFLYTERLVKLGGSPFEWGVTLETRWHELSARQKDWIKQAAWDFGYMLDFVSVNTQLQAILIGMAEQYGQRPIKFGFTDV